MSTAIVWFRKSLRLHDNPALLHACCKNSITSILPLFIVDTDIVGSDFGKYHANRLHFLLESLEDLDENLKSKFGSKLSVLFGKPTEIFDQLFKEFGPTISLFSSDYCSEPHGRSLSSEIDEKINLHSPSTEVVFHPSVQTVLDIEEVSQDPVYKEPKSMKEIEKIFLHKFGLDDSGLLVLPKPLPPPSKIPSPSAPLESFCSTFSSTNGISSSKSLREHLSNDKRLPKSSSNSYFKGGESEALNRLCIKVEGQSEFVNSFKKPKTFSTNQSDNPFEPSTTGLSPYLSNGNLSVRRLWQEVQVCNRSSSHSQPPESLTGQLLFREMFYLLSRSVKNWDDDSNNKMCKKITWGKRDQKLVVAWEEGRTGFPLIDAMMRQLESTGWMHHLGRHAVSCFFTRGQLWQHWKLGRDIFEHKLLDSDWALNNGNWLWLSGVAPFSMPYFRLYNPCPDAKSSLNVETTQATFIKHWIPELANMPAKYVYEPHLAPLGIQEEAHCIIGKHYPAPIVERKESAKLNLAKFKQSLAA